jgi:DNA polymerase III epsilon subunit-like protein
MIVVDVEASGLNPELHSIVSIGALEFERPENRFYGECRVWDGAHIQDEALKVNGFSREEVTSASKQPESELIIAFLEWTMMIEDRTIAGQNPAVLDRAIIEAAAHRAGRELRLAHRTIDVHSVAYTHYVLHGKNLPFDRQKSHSALDLDAILRYVGLPEEPRPHNGLTGALLEAEALSRLFHNKPLLEEYRKYRIPWQR